MTAKADNARTQDAMRRKAEERGKEPVCVCGQARNQHQMAPPYACWDPGCPCGEYRAAERRGKVRVPPDRDKLARWLGDGQALLARLQESFADLFLLQDVTQPSALGLSRSVAELIRVAREHFQELPHED